MKRSFAWVGLLSVWLSMGCAQSAIDVSELNAEPGDAATAHDAGSVVDASGIDARVVEDAQVSPRDATADATGDAGFDASATSDASVTADASVNDASVTPDAGQCPACLFPGSICRDLFGNCGCQLIPLGICALPPFL